MDYHLQNLRTAETYALDPRRSLIGSADHALIRTSSGPFLAALVVRYSTGWVVHGLADDPAVKFDGNPLRASQQVVPVTGSVLTIGTAKFRFSPVRVAIERGSNPTPVAPSDSAPPCLAYVRGPDEVEECRAVDHDLLFGRLPICHVRYPDTRLSRLHALLAAHEGMWYLHPLSKNPVARNRELITGFTPIEDKDELIIGPLIVRIEMRSVAVETERIPTRDTPHDDPLLGPAATDEFAGSTIDTPYPGVADAIADLTALRAMGLRLDHWLKSQKPEPASGSQGGIGSWFGAQRAKLNRFWYDTPETTSARAMRTAGRLNDAFGVLDRALRARPDSPELLRELYRLYEVAGMYDLCYRPLRQIEDLAAAQGKPDTWVLETLARNCERMGREKPAMYDRAVAYWRKLEAVTGVSYARERDAAMANRTLREGGFSGNTSDGT